MATQQEFVDALRRGLDDQFKPLAEEVLGGRCQSYDQYREMVGMMAGLRSARDTIDELVRKANSGEVL